MSRGLLRALDPTLQWAVDRLVAEFSECVILYEPGAPGAQIISVQLPDGMRFSRFLQAPPGACEPDYERMTETRLETLISKVYCYLRTGERPKLGEPEP